MKIPLQMYLNVRSTDLWAFLIALYFVSVPVWAQEVKMTIAGAIKHDTSPPLRELARKQPVLNRNKELEFPRERLGLHKPAEQTVADGGLQSSAVTTEALGSTPQPILSVPGLSDDDNFQLYGYKVVPPDSNGDIGLNENGERIYIQYINLALGIFNASSGALVAGPYAANGFWTGFGGPCESSNEGYPIVLYDDHAGRWVFSLAAVSDGIQCVAISITSDPLGPYHRYAFVVTPGGLNVDLKLGVWDDGTVGSNGQSAYTFTNREFDQSGSFLSFGAGAMNRDAMLQGSPASFIEFSKPCSSDCIEGQLPPHLAGPAPPNGTCPTFWAAMDAHYDYSPFKQDGYRNHKLCVNWSNPGISTYVEGQLVPAGSDFDRSLWSGYGDCIRPVKGGEALDCSTAFTMYRAQYRWFGNHASVVLNTTVDADAGGDRAGIRWAETRSASGDTNWSLQQDGTYAPDDGLERWMGSIAQDQSGSIALGYSVAGENLYPSVRYTSRLAGDVAGTLPGGEVSCHEGTGAQVSSGGRWGDYSSMSVDPVDGCTFWYTQEYYETTGSFDFKTRICSFRLPESKCMGSVFKDSFEALPPVCGPTDVQLCYEGPPETLGVGLCTAGTRTCNTEGQWGVCEDWIGPTEEICADGQDNNCDGSIDPGCAGESCNPLDSDGTCLDSLGCYIDSCHNNNCNAVCNAKGSGREGSVCVESTDCRSGFQCWNTGAGSYCLKTCAPGVPSQCSVGSTCVSTGNYVDGQLIGACSLN